MILKGFGIDAATVGRGIPSGIQSGQPFTWTSPDGSSVRALAQGYGGAVGLPFPDMWRNIPLHMPDNAHAEEWAEKWMQRKSQLHTSALYASAGVDHMELRPGMGAIVRHLDEIEMANIGSVPIPPH